VIVELFENENDLRPNAVFQYFSSIAIDTHIRDFHAGDIPQCLVGSLKSYFDCIVKAFRGSCYDLGNSSDSACHVIVLPAGVASRPSTLDN
jgi:hypothetical protein